MTQYTGVGPQPDDNDSDAEALTGVAAIQTHEDAALSAYIDHRLDAVETAALEARLATDAPLHARLTQMRHAVTLVRELPTHRPPRSFVLDDVTAARLRTLPTRIVPATVVEAQVMPAASVLLPAPRRLPIRTALRAASALVAVLLVAITAFDIAGAFTPAAPTTPQVAVVAPTQTLHPPRTVRPCDSDNNGSNCIANEATIALPTLRPTPAPVATPAPAVQAGSAPVRLLEAVLLVLAVLLAAASFTVTNSPPRRVRPHGP